MLFGCCAECCKAGRDDQPATTVNGNVTLGRSAARNAASSRTRNITAQPRNIFYPATPITSSSRGSNQNVSDDPPPAYELAEMPAAIVRDGRGRQKNIVNMV